MLGLVPIGRLADSVGTRQILISLYISRGLCFLAYPFLPNATVFYVVAFLTGIGEWGVGPVQRSLVGAIGGPEAAVRTLAIIGTVRNIGFGVGAILGTVGLAFHSTTLYAAIILADALTFLLAAALMRRLPKSADAVHVSRAGATLARVPNGRFMVLAALNGVLFLHSIVLSVGIPLWLATKTEAPPALIGVVIVINTVIATVIQVPATRRVVSLAAGARRQLWAGAALAVSCVLLAPTASLRSWSLVVVVLASVLALTFAEIWQSIGAWKISLDLSPENARTQYLSVYDLGTSVASALGPLALGAVVIAHGAMGWLTLGAVMLLCGTAVAVIVGVASPGRERIAGGKQG